MSQGPSGQAPPEHGNGAQSTSQTVKNEARDVATTAVEQGGSVAKTAAKEAKHVAGHTKREAQDLLREGRDQLEDQARNGQRQAARSLHDLAGELDRMAEGTDSPGVATDLTRQASERVHAVAEWLDHREPGQLLDEVRGFARRRPGTFLVGAVIAGALAGRLTRAAVAGKPEDDHQQHTGAAPGPAAPALPTPAPQGTLAGPSGFSAPQPPAAPVGARPSATGQVP